MTEDLSVRIHSSPNYPLQIFPFIRTLALEDCPKDFIVSINKQINELKHSR